jgi:hypothetical protein
MRGMSRGMKCGMLGLGYSWNSSMTMSGHSVRTLNESTLRVRRAPGSFVEAAGEEEEEGGGGSEEGGGIDERSTPEGRAGRSGQG